MKSNTDTYFRNFNKPIDAFVLPNQFNYPFVVDIHPLCQMAIDELTEYLTKTTDFTHDFGIYEAKESSIGKMFGVLVVKTNEGKVGYICAYSGKLANSNHVSFFVPPVFDMLDEESFFLSEELILNDLNAKIEVLNLDSTYLSNLTRFQNLQKEKDLVILEKKNNNKKLKVERKKLREIKLLELNSSDYADFEADLIKQSLRDKHELHVLLEEYHLKLQALKNEIDIFENEIEQLKEERKSRSNLLQRKLFQSYAFLNAKGETKNLLDIFETHLHLQPPAGAGECCAPKLLHFAYKHALKPLALAEFWWGVSPKSEVKKHMQTYPSCWGKCQPILGHMLEGIEVKENPLLNNPAEGKDLEIIYDDAYLVVVNKPAEFLSVPGINVYDSVYTRIKNRYPNATGPLIVHRLDMSTSGLMILAKSKDVHKHLQSQFIKRTVSKKYVALLEGKISKKEGIISLPLRVDLDDRPKQMVCYEFGKNAETKFNCFEYSDGFTRVNYYPITGRTHQLRMHSAHQQGLNAPIKGDDLYGKESDRLYLHAEELIITHPITEEKITFTAKAPF